MANLSYQSLLLIPLLFALVFAKRKLIFDGITPLGIFVGGWLVVNYFASMLLIFFPADVADYWKEFALMFSFLDEDAIERMYLVNHIGLLLFLVGALLVARRYPKRQALAYSILKRKHLNIRGCALLFIVLSLWAFVSLVRAYGGSPPLMVLFTSGFQEAYYYRVSDVRISQIWIYLSMNVIPFLAAYIFCYGRLSPKGSQWRVIGLVALAIGGFFLLSLLHKRQFVNWVAGVGFLILLTSSGVQKKALRSQLILLSKVGAVAFLFLIMLFAAFSSVDSVYSDVTVAAERAAMEILFRGTLSAIPYFSLVPEYIDYHEFSNIGLFYYLRGESVQHSDTQLIFEYLNPGTEGGSISSHFITDFYAAYGYPSLVIGCLISGMLFGAIDRFYRTLPVSAPNQVLRAFILLFPLNLLSATFFQSILGYGLFFFMSTWFLLKIFHPQRRALTARVPAQFPPQQPIDEMQQGLRARSIHAYE